jgi:hypothetical protein
VHIKAAAKSAIGSACGFATITAMSDRETILRYLFAAMLAAVFTASVIYISMTYR